jgi:hypothetical protein
VVTNTIEFRDVVIGVLVVILAGMAFGLYKSAPPAVQVMLGGILKYGMSEIVKLAEAKKDEAATNNIDWDDPLWEEIYKLLKGREDAFDAILNTPTPPQEPQG